MTAPREDHSRHRAKSVAVSSASSGPSAYAEQQEKDAGTFTCCAVVDAVGRVGHRFDLERDPYRGVGVATRRLARPVPVLWWPDGRRAVFGRVA